MKFAVIAAIVSFNLAEAVKIEQKNDWYQGPWEQEWSNQWRDQREQNKEAEKKKEEDEKMVQLHSDQRSRYNYIQGWYDPAEHPNEYTLGSSSIENGEQKQEEDEDKKKKKKQEDDPWKLMMQNCEDCGYDGKKFKASDLYAAGRSHSGYLNSSDVPLWHDNDSGYKDEFKQMEKKMKQSGEDWGPRQWFDAGKEWVAPVQESNNADENESESQNNDSSSQGNQPVVTPDYLLGGSDFRQYYDEPKRQKDNKRQQEYNPYAYQPIKIQDDPMLGYHYDEYDQWEDEYARPEDKYWSDEKPEGYVPSAWEQRNMYRQAYNDYGQTMPQWNDYMPEETQQQINDYRDNYDGKKAWWKNKDFNVDLEPTRESWGNAVYDWQMDAPTWDSWSNEQGW